METKSKAKKLEILDQPIPIFTTKGDMDLKGLSHQQAKISVYSFMVIMNITKEFQNVSPVSMMHSSYFMKI